MPEHDHTRLAIEVKHNDVEFALRLLKRQVQKAGLIRELRRRRQYEKPRNAGAGNSAPASRTPGNVSGCCTASCGACGL